MGEERCEASLTSDVQINMCPIKLLYKSKIVLRTAEFKKDSDLGRFEAFVGSYNSTFF